MPVSDSILPDRCRRTAGRAVWCQSLTALFPKVLACVAPDGCVASGGSERRNSPITFPALSPAIFRVSGCASVRVSAVKARSCGGPKGPPSTPPSNPSSSPTPNYNPRANRANRPNSRTEPLVCGSALAQADRLSVLACSLLAIHGQDLLADPSATSRPSSASRSKRLLAKSHALGSTRERVHRGRAHD